METLMARRAWMAIPQTKRPQTPVQTTILRKLLVTTDREKKFHNKEKKKKEIYVHQSILQKALEGRL